MADGDVRRFDLAFFGHVGFVIVNAVRAVLLGVTNGGLLRPPVGGKSKAVLRSADPHERSLRGGIRCGDGHAGGKAQTQGEDHWTPGRRVGLDVPGLGRAETVQRRRTTRLRRSLRGVVVSARPVQDPDRARRNSSQSPQPCRGVGVVARGLPTRRPASVRRTTGWAAPWRAGFLDDREASQLLTRDIYIPPADEPGLGRLDAALDHAVPALAVERKIRDAVRAGLLDKAPGDALLDRAVHAGIITTEERQDVLKADEIRDEVIQVDAFAPEAFASLRG